MGSKATVTPCRPPDSAAPLPPSGATATTPPPSSHTQQVMAGINELPEESELGPTHSFVPNLPAHYQQGAYPYPRGNGNYAVDQDIQMAHELSHNMQQNVGDQAPTSAPRSNSHSHGHAHTMEMSQTTPNAPGMAPPNRQSHSFSGGPSSAVEGTHDQMMGDGKRKRSKVSRACDECRRKKIRCDATDDDGSVKTCSNCARINQTCSFSRIPMKRGPSKGYIKELSERVQQVESLQMAMSGSSGYRPSIDSDYSPEEPFSGSKRNFSFSGNNNPFAAPQFNRDRLPSTGGWGNSSPTAGYRVRGSIAIAPDQELPDVPAAVNGQLAYSKPFWHQFTEGEQRPAKRQKTTDEDEMYKGFHDIEQEALTGYFETIHDVLPILPQQAEIITAHLRNTPAKLPHAFKYVLNLVQGKDQGPGNAFPNYKAVEEYVWSQAIQEPSMRTASENLVWLWTYLFMILDCDKNLKTLRGSDGEVSKSTLVKLAIDLGEFQMDNLEEANPQVDASADSNANLARQAYCCARILRGLHALSMSTTDPTTARRPGKIGLLQQYEASLPEKTCLLERASRLFTVLEASIRHQCWYSGESVSFAYSARAFIEESLNLIRGEPNRVIASGPQSPEFHNLAKQIELFAAILLARHTFIDHPMEILAPTLELSDNLVSTTTATVTPKYNPLDIHLFTLTTITLLEFADSVDNYLTQPSLEALPKVQRALEQIAERANADSPERGPSTGEAIPGRTDGDMTLHWASCLLRLIGAKLQPGRAASSNGVGDARGGDAQSGRGQEERTAPTNGNGAPGADAINLLAAQQTSAPQAIQTSGNYGMGDKIIDRKTGVVQLVDFKLLLKHGYLNVLADLVGL